jgi:hypothetical protein
MVVAVQNAEVVWPEGNEGVKSDASACISEYFSYGRGRSIVYLRMVEMVIAAVIAIPVFHARLSCALLLLTPPRTRYVSGNPKLTGVAVFEISLKPGSRLWQRST